MAASSRLMGLFELSMRSAGMTAAAGVFDRPRTKGNVVILGAIRDGVQVGDGDFPLTGQVEEHCAEMLAWARERGGTLKARRFCAPPLIRERGQPRNGMTVALLTFDRPETAFWFKMRWA